MPPAASSRRAERVPDEDIQQQAAVDTSMSISSDTVISFPAGLPGFESCRRFVLMTSPELEPLARLQSVSGPDASFVGIDPKRLLPAYRCELNDADRERLGASDDAALLWLALIAIEPDGTATANLRAPIVINPATMTGLQLMPHRCLYAVRHVITDVV